MGSGVDSVGDPDLDNLHEIIGVVDRLLDGVEWVFGRSVLVRITDFRIARGGIERAVVIDVDDSVGLFALVGDAVDIDVPAEAAEDVAGIDFSVGVAVDERFALVGDHVQVAVLADAVGNVAARVGLSVVVAVGRGLVRIDHLIEQLVVAGGEFCVPVEFEGFVAACGFEREIDAHGGAEQVGLVEYAVVVVVSGLELDNLHAEYRVHVFAHGFLYPRVESEADIGHAAVVEMAVTHERAGVGLIFIFDAFDGRAVALVGWTAIERVVRAEVVSQFMGEHIHIPVVLVGMLDRRGKVAVHAAQGVALGMAAQTADGGGDSTEHRVGQQMGQGAVHVFHVLFPIGDKCGEVAPVVDRTPWLVVRLPYADVPVRDAQLGAGISTIDVAGHRSQDGGVVSGVLRGVEKGRIVVLALNEDVRDPHLKGCTAS